MDYSLASSSVHEILQARILEWVAISFFKGSSPLRDQTCVSYVSCIGRWVLYHWATREAPASLHSTWNYLLAYLCFFFFLPMDGEYLDVRDCVLANYAENVLFDNQMMTSEHLLFSLVVFWQLPPSAPPEPGRCSRRADCCVWSLSGTLCTYQW